ncbi:hypothetical protein IWX90DRAFT_141883 [Phyllosticta citrichinensis]|uniref:Uncharacterized protein n=1 Tax=Phyllosticta citrichinensis TaxID=1130410 RepID=A0ABR1XYQ9_9PEZI
MPCHHPPLFVVRQPNNTQSAYHSLHRWLSCASTQHEPPDCCRHDKAALAIGGGFVCLCLPRGPSILHKYPCAHQSASSPIKFTMTANHWRCCSIDPSTFQSNPPQLHCDHALRPASPVATVRLDRTAHRAASNHQTKTNKRRRGPRGSASLVVSFVGPASRRRESRKPSI